MGEGWGKELLTAVIWGAYIWRFLAHLSPLLGDIKISTLEIHSFGQINFFALQSESTRITNEALPHFRWMSWVFSGKGGLSNWGDGRFWGRRGEPQHVKLRRQSLGMLLGEWKVSTSLLPFWWVAVFGVWVPLLVTRLAVLLTFSGHMPRVLNTLQCTGKPQTARTVPTKMPTPPPLITLENAKIGL